MLQRYARVMALLEGCFEPQAEKGTGLRLFFQESRDGWRQAQLARMRMAERRHFSPGLCQYPRELFRIGLYAEIAEIIFQEYDTDDIFEELRLRVRFHALF